MTSRSLKQAVAAGAAALLLVAGALGVARAQQGTTTTSTSTTASTSTSSTSSAATTAAATTAPRTGAARTGPGGDRGQLYEQYLATLAGKLNISVDRLKQLMTESRQAVGLTEHPDGGPGGHG